MKDTTQVILANMGGIGVSLSGVNDILTFCSISLAIIFTIYKFHFLNQQFQPFLLYSTISNFDLNF